MDPQIRPETAPSPIFFGRQHEYRFTFHRVWMPVRTSEALKAHLALPVPFCEETGREILIDRYFFLYLLSAKFEVALKESFPELCGEGLSGIAYTFLREEGLIGMSHHPAPIPGLFKHFVNNPVFNVMAALFIQEAELKPLLDAKQTMLYPAASSLVRGLAQISACHFIKEQLPRNF